ncbi:MAG: SAM-dependent methyltransferase, partial [Xanthobacteraceae bacterium]|nr:SAM-dependent methyltransferase [Xanthobacteraceae bacterium]
MNKPTKPAKPGATENDWTKLWPSQNPRKSEPLLKALHILTRDGALNADSRRKLTQVLHLTQLLKPAIEAMLASSDDPVLADLGAGKSYLGFILYDLLIGPSAKGRVIGIETRDKLVESSRALAAQAGYDRLDFITSPIAEANLPGGRADMVTALHA